MLGYIFNQYQLAAWVGLGKPNAQLRFCLELRSVYHALAPWALVGNSEDRSLVWHRATIWHCYRNPRGYNVSSIHRRPCSFADHLASGFRQTFCSGWILGVVTAWVGAPPSGFC